MKSRELAQNDLQDQMLWVGRMSNIQQRLKRLWLASWFSHDSHLTAG
jgi:hypothetical protein